MGSRRPATSTEVQVETVTVSIYQNSDHVAGLVQQLFDAPLVTGSTREDHDDGSRTSTASGALQVSGEAEAKIPLAGKGSVGAQGSGAYARSKVIATGSKSTQTFVYSQAYYLNIVRRALRERGLLKRVTNRGEAATLASGDFVEYEASFSPSELTTIMDVLTPDLVAQITRWLTVKNETRLFDGFDGDFDRVKIAALAMNERAAAKADLARDVTRALQADFRQDKTREYYGLIGSGADAVTAITICDNAHFTVDDEDRILDGVFTVLGKVTSPPEDDVPVLQRNKLLRNLAPEGVDAAVTSLRASLAGQAATSIGGVRVDQVLDLKLASRVAGASVRVVPIAIYV